ncbi:hypothetical protein BIW11_07674 [Tropilaelaps mercedesae]|uniref:Uncharacterized protein n=1 Tax=Tropilaelaps mercedesae TaxID=418985 RepID=A0A1V9XT33_9ACAR|nr:hypothetical protein BIW11_07674 [Tropilaelaps mercedesae]
MKQSPCLFCTFHKFYPPTSADVIAHVKKGAGAGETQQPPKSEGHSGQHHSEPLRLRAAIAADLPRVMPQHPVTSVYTKLPLKQIQSAPFEAARDPREPDGSPPDLRMAQRTLHELQRFRALQQMVEAQAHLHGQRQLYTPYVARMVPGQGQKDQIAQSNGTHRHSPPIIPVSRRYASSSQPPLNRRPMGGMPAHAGHRQSPTSSQRQSPPVLSRRSPPQGPQQAYGAGPHGSSNHNHSYLYHNSSSPDCLALLFGSASVAAAAAGQHSSNANGPQTLEHQYPRTSTPHLQSQAHIQFSDSGAAAAAFGSAGLCCSPQTSTPVHGQNVAYTNVNAVNTASAHRSQPLQALHRVPSARASRPKSPSPLLRGSDGVCEQHPIRRSASYTERQLRKCIGRTTEEIRDLEQQLRELIISSASIVDQPASVEEGLAEILGNRQDLAEDPDPDQDITVTSNTNNSTKDNTRNSPPSVSRSRSDTNTPPSRHSSDPERHLSVHFSRPTRHLAYPALKLSSAGVQLRSLAGHVIDELLVVYKKPCPVRDTE